MKFTCFKIKLNGEEVATTGGPDVETMGASLSFLKGKNLVRFTVGGLNEPSSDFFQHIDWGDERALKNNDKLEIEVIESESADPFNVDSSYGSNLEKKEYFCSFCASKADKNNGMYLSSKANICHKCLKELSEKLL